VIEKGSFSPVVLNRRLSSSPVRRLFSFAGFTIGTSLYSLVRHVPISSPNHRRLLMNDRKTISIMKACEVVGVSRRTIYNWIASGKVEYIRTAGGSVRIFVDTLWRQPGRADLTSKEAS
jgi:excisionase family DNA binding protein